MVKSMATWKEKPAAWKTEPWWRDQRWGLVFASGMFLSFSLFVYRAYSFPGGLSDSGHSLVVRALCFGVLTSLSFYLNEFLLRPRLPFSPPHYAWCAWELWVGGTLTFLLYNFFWHWSDLRLDTYLRMLLEYSGIILIPLAGIYLYGKSRFRQADGDALPALPVRPTVITFTSSNGRQQLSMAPEDFLYATSADNYLKIVFLKNGRLASMLIRGTLKTLENEFSDYPFERCHRSYLFNTQNITRIERHNSKVRVFLKQVEKALPVSETYLSRFNHLLSGQD